MNNLDVRLTKWPLIFNLLSLLLARIGRRQLTDQMVDSIVYNTPPKHRGSKRFFRQLEDAGTTFDNRFSLSLYRYSAGLISFSEYLFLWVVLTSKPDIFILVHHYTFHLRTIDGISYCICDV